MIDWSLSDEDNLAQLVEVVSKPTGRLVTFGEIARDLGDHAYGVIVRVFMAAQQADPGLVPAFNALSTVGMMLDTPSRLAMIDQLATAGYGPSGLEPWPAEWVAKIKAMGVTTGPRWQIELGLTEAPTLESIAAARQRNDATIALNDVTHRANLAVSEASAKYDADATAAEISAAAQTAWAGGG